MATDTLIRMPGGGLPTEPPDDPAERYEAPADRLVGTLKCPKCGRAWDWDEFGEIVFRKNVAHITVECPCGTVASVPIL